MAPLRFAPISDCIEQDRIMFGLPTNEMLMRMAERDREHQRRVESLMATKGMPMSEAYMRVSCAMQWEERDAIEQAKLADIRENGT